MHAELVALVLVSALLHAIWGAVVKSSADRLMATTVGTLVPALICLFLVRTVTAPDAAAWPFIAGSVALHMAYYAFLLLAYRFGDLSQVYPVARGGTPLVVGAIAVLVIGEALSPMRMAGIAIVAIGLFVIAADRRLLTAHGALAIGAALLAAIMIGTATAVDFVGLHRANSTLGYIVWINLLEGLVLLPLALAIRRNALKALPWRELPKQGFAGLIVVASYGMMLWALSLGAVAPIAALRETSVVFAVLIGAAFLGEPMGRKRAVAAIIVAIGALVVNF
jgi:uncharacterized membrane protein